METKSSTWLKHLFAAGSLAFLASCGGGGAGGGGGASVTTAASSGTVHFSMTDAPACGFDHVNVTVSKVRVHQSATATDTDSGWNDVVLNPAVKIDLLNLTNGVLQDLGQTSLPAGHYSQLRLVLAANGSSAPYANSVVQSNTTNEVALDTPSAIQSGIKLINEFDVSAGTQADLVLDFDACKSIVTKGHSGGFLLMPVIRVIPKVTSGSITGYVTPGMTHVAVSVQQNGTVLKSTVPDSTTGAFTLSPVTPSGTSNYVVVVTADGHATAAITNVPVTTGTATALSTSAAPISLQTSTTHTVAGVITPIAASGSVQAMQTLSAGAQKIEVAYQAADATTGAYTLSLPAAAPSVGQFGALPIALTADTAVAGKYTISASASGYTTQNSDVDVGANASATANFTLTP